jgi:Cys-tRNA(Pro)/Cys-tRNA(Cys) deacylase
MKIDKTNAIRLLDKQKIEYNLVSYVVDENDLSAVHVAEQLNESVDQVFKTLVLKGDKSGYFICIIPGAKELNLKVAAKVSGNKNCDMIPVKDLLAVTGYIRGACSPVGMKKQYPTYIDKTVEKHASIYISAGKRGLQIQIKPQDLFQIVNFKVENLSE